VGDTQVEADETFSVRLSQPVHAALGDSIAQVTIIDDDGGVDVPGSEVPATSFLANATPNPSRGTVAIRWGLSAAARADLSVFDVQGRRVRRLVDGERAAGRAITAWDGRDDAGQKVASGLYLVRLQLGAQVFRTTLLRMQ